MSGIRFMGVEYRPYRSKRILNVHKHVDGGWFWDKYSAHPYVGCEHGCEFCYSRSRKYLQTGGPEDFSRIIKVKTNAPEQLIKELSKVPRDIIVTGDYQPAEGKFKLSRKMLEVIRDLNFPVHIVERSPLVLRDLGILQEINKRSWACVSISITTLDEKLMRLFEPKAPTPRSRLRAMKKINEAGILTGTALMPVLPYLTDSDATFEEIVKSTAEHGGRYVLAGGGLTLDDDVKTRYMKLIQEHSPSLVEKYDELYSSQDRLKCYAATVGKKIAALCEKYGVADRIPRYIPDSPLKKNKEVAAALFDKVYRLELELENPQKIWAYRKAAWAIEGLEDDIEELYRSERLEEVRGVGKTLAAEIGKMLEQV